MQFKHSQFAVAATIIGFLTLAVTKSHGAKMPLDAENLKKQATHIVSGTVLEVTSKTQKSKNKLSRGIHRDRIYTIQVRLTQVSKGKEARAKEVIKVIAWKPLLPNGMVVEKKGKEAAKTEKKK